MNDDARIGAPRKRMEDSRFLTGASCFTDDVALAGQLHAVVVRSPHAHARIRAVDTAAARSAPGVRLVLAAVDVDERDAPWMKESATSGQTVWPPVHANQASTRVESRPIAFMVSNIVRRS
jgi:carbon-monoxide dehydrogenase large subunit